MDRDSWETPLDLFKELDEEFNFEVDLCATFSNTKCDWWCEDFFNDEATNCHGECNENWYYERFKSCFMNPPYSNPLPFIEKAWDDSKWCRIVMLLPAKTDTKWFRVFYDPTHGPREGAQVRFMPYAEHHKSRVSFIHPEFKRPVSGNPCGSIVVILDRQHLTNE